MLTDKEIPDLYAKGGFAKNSHAIAGVEAFVKLRDEGVFCDDVEGLTVAAANEMFILKRQLCSTVGHGSLRSAQTKSKTI